MREVPEIIERRILIIRGQKVMLDSDLAKLYGVPTMRLNEQVKRNFGRFPEDFMFRLTKDEYENLISQIAISNSNPSQFAIGSQRHRDPRLRPYAFTEHGVAMLSSVLRSKRAVQMNIFIIRAFVKLREMLATHKELANKLEVLERKQKEHGGQLEQVYSILKQLIDPPAKESKPMGFETKDSF